MSAVVDCSTLRSTQRRLTRRPAAQCQLSCLQLVGHVDVPATLASISAGEESAYSEVEACLVRMEALTTLRPACSAEYAEMYRCAADHNWLTYCLVGRRSSLSRVRIPSLHTLHLSRASPPVFNPRSLGSRLFAAQRA